MRMNMPSVVIENNTNINVTKILVRDLSTQSTCLSLHSPDIEGARHVFLQVNSSKNYGVLFKVVQVMADLNLIVKKAYIASEGGWFLDVFNVTDQGGNKITDEGILDYIKNVSHLILLGNSKILPRVCQTRRFLNDSFLFVFPSTDHTTIELIGRDRPGLLSDVSAVLMNLGCNIVSGEVWTHNNRMASVIHFTDSDTGSAISDMCRLAHINKLLSKLLESSDESTTTAMAAVPDKIHHPARRIHQMMFNDRDFEIADHDEISEDSHENKDLPKVRIDDCKDKDYSLVMIWSADRPKLLFDTVCTLTDMGYVVYHACIDAESPEAYQEYYIRHTNGQPVKTDVERQRLKLCLRAAIKRRVSEGLKFELYTVDRVGLLADVTCKIRENGLTLTRAEIKTDKGQAMNTFYVRNALGYPVDYKIVDSIRESIGRTALQVKGGPEFEKTEAAAAQESPRGFPFDLWKPLKHFSMLRSILYRELKLLVTVAGVAGLQK
ncbi:hypothetical protein SAY86_001979 [Trapa natans]|uniref:ACT domain-containing protein ACR n=1 Tax=Trapa natans TaxID=22666 RepID=A0AAN7LPU8_TRANT|nr:hypothetical protein SAY86_001979 [Trapa natans]